MSDQMNLTCKNIIRDINFYTKKEAYIRTLYKMCGIELFTFCDHSEVNLLAYVCNKYEDIALVFLDLMKEEQQTEIIPILTTNWAALVSQKRVKTTILQWAINSECPKVVKAVIKLIKQPNDFTYIVTKIFSSSNKANAIQLATQVGKMEVISSLLDAAKEHGVVYDVLSSLSDNGLHTMSFVFVNCPSLSKNVLDYVGDRKIELLASMSTSESGSFLAKVMSFSYKCYLMSLYSFENLFECHGFYQPLENDDEVELECSVQDSF